MKTRTKVIAIDCLAGFPLVFLFVLPLVMFGFGYKPPAWKYLWFIVLIPSAVLIAFTVRSVPQIRFVSCLERRSWARCAAFPQSRMVRPSLRWLHRGTTDWMIRMQILSCVPAQDEDALARIQDSLDTSGKNLQGRYTLDLAVAWLALGRAERTLRLCQTLPLDIVRADRVWIIFTKASALRRLGRLEEAVAMFSSVYMVDSPDSPIDPLAALLAARETCRSLDEGALFADAPLLLSAADALCRRIEAAFPDGSLERQFALASEDPRLAWFTPLMAETRMWMRSFSHPDIGSSMADPIRVSTRSAP